jgi:hypothetical protein
MGGFFAIWSGIDANDIIKLPSNTFCAAAENEKQAGKKIIKINFNRIKNIQQSYQKHGNNNYPGNKTFTSF